MNARRQFYRLARNAIRRGLLTAEERDAIGRVGTRKAGYWQRHLEDLRDAVRERARLVAA